MSEAIQTDDGFNVVETTSLMGFINREVGGHSEYIHLVPDLNNRELRCYRSVSGEDGPNERIKTTISNVSFRSFGEADITDIKHFYLTYMEAMTFMSYLASLAKSRSSDLTFQWDDSDGGTMMDDEATSMEAITLGYDTFDGHRRQAQIRSEWQSNGQKMANIEGEKKF